MTLDEVRSLLDGTRSRIRMRGSRLRATRSPSRFRTIKNPSIRSTDGILNLKEIMMTNEKTFLGVTDYDDLIATEFYTNRVAKGEHTVHRQTIVHTTRANWLSYVESTYKDDLDFVILQTGRSAGLILNHKNHEFIDYKVDSNSTTVRVSGGSDFVDTVIREVEIEFDKVVCNVDWVYSADGSSVNVPLNTSRLPVDEMYPFLNGRTLTDYYDSYMNSSASILLLIGQPGTGKTSFIRGLLAHTQSSAIVTYDASILEKDYLFARFIEDDYNVMVLEDSDAFLKPRTDGNTMMHRFLNVGDGLVTTNGKKLIFSTNLPSVADIDTALTRPGRCFDIITFDSLDVNRAKSLANRLGVELPVRPRGKEFDNYTLAEIYNKQSEQAERVKTRKVGFI